MGWQMAWRRGMQNQSLKPGKKLRILTWPCKKMSGIWILMVRKLHFSGTYWCTPFFKKILIFFKEKMKRNRGSGLWCVPPRGDAGLVRGVLHSTARPRRQNSNWTRWFSWLGAAGQAVWARTRSGGTRELDGRDCSARGRRQSRRHFLRHRVTLQVPISYACTGLAMERFSSRASATPTNVQPKNVKRNRGEKREPVRQPVSHPSQKLDWERSSTAPDQASQA